MQHRRSSRSPSLLTAPSLLLSPFSSLRSLRSLSSLSSASSLQRLRDARARVLGLLRQSNIVREDPLAFAPCIEHHGARLGFFHLYTPDADRKTLAWFASPAYAEEARQQHPIDTCHLGIAQFHAVLLTAEAAAGTAGGDEAHARAREAFLATAERLLASGLRATLRGRDCLWIPHFDQLEGYRPHHKPWAASMVQGWAAAIFMRAAQLSGDERFALAARRTTGLFFVPVAEGGVLDALPHRLPFYEKYPMPGQVRHVFNGYMSSLFGLWDLARSDGDAVARELFEQGMATLSDERTLRAYDNGYSTLYDLGGDRRATPAGVFYTWVHARQLAGLARITGDRRLLPWAERWRDYLTHRRFRLRSSADCLYFRAKRLPVYVERYLAPTDAAAE